MAARRQEWEHGTVFGYDKRGCRCEACRLARHNYDQARYAAVRERRLQQVKEYREAHRDKQQRWTREQYHRDPAKAKARSAAWAAANPEAVRARELRYSQSEKGRLKAARNQARRRGVVTDEWTDEYIAILLKDPCCYCGGPGGTVDHIVPISKGGTSEWDNLAPACQSCNSSKRDFDLLGFMSRKAS